MKNAEMDPNRPKNLIKRDNNVVWQGGVQSDFAYFPFVKKHTVLENMRWLNRHNIMHEIAFPMLISLLHNAEDINLLSLNLCTAWTGPRNYPRQFLENCREYFDVGVLHPVKFSSKSEIYLDFFEEFTKFSL